MKQDLKEIREIINHAKNGKYKFEEDESKDEELIALEKEIQDETMKYAAFRKKHYQQNNTECHYSNRLFSQSAPTLMTTNNDNPSKKEMSI